MKLIESQNLLITWYLNKLDFSHCRLLWIVFCKRLFVQLIFARLIEYQMFKQEALLEYLSSPEGINKIIVGIILVGAINAILITYSVRSTYGAAKKARKKLKIQRLLICKNIRFCIFQQKFREKYRKIRETYVQKLGHFVPCSTLTIFTVNLIQKDIK